MDKTSFVTMITDWFTQARFVTKMTISPLGFEIVKRTRTREIQEIHAKKIKGTINFSPEFIRELTNVMWEQVQNSLFFIEKSRQSLLNFIR